MRIIAGAFKGRRLAPVKGRTRPTAAKVREAMFNILGPAVAGGEGAGPVCRHRRPGDRGPEPGGGRGGLRGGPPRGRQGAAPQPGGPGPAGPHQVWPLPVAVALKKLAAGASASAWSSWTPLTAAAWRWRPWRPWPRWTCSAPGARVVVEHSRRETLPEACGAFRRLGSAALWRHPGGFLSGGRTSPTGA